MSFDIHALSLSILSIISSVGPKIVGAIVLFFIGRPLIKFGPRVVTRVLTRQKIDATLVSYAATSLSVVLNIVLVVAILGFFGVETTSFAALLARRWPRSRRGVRRTACQFRRGRVPDSAAAV